MQDLHRKDRGPSDPLDHILSYSVSKTSLLVNREVLRADYIPGSLPHRWEHIRRLGEILSPSLLLSRPSNIFIYGKTGTGKTAVVKHVFRRFSEKAEAINANLKFVYMNCRLIGTEYRILSELCSSVNVKVPFTGLSKAEVYNRFRSALLQSPCLILACLDEIDVLVKNYGDSLIYELTRINEGSESGKLSIVGVSNDLMFKEMLDPRVLSSLSEEEIVFHPYTAIELIDILTERASLAFREGAVQQSVINLCAALAASEHGDARRALDLLRVAAEIAERNQSETVEERHVKIALGVIEQGRVYEALSTLPLHGRIVLLAVYHLVRSGVGKITSGNVYKAYKSLCLQLNVDPLTDRRVSGLLSELDMLGVISSDVVSFGRYGRTRKISLKVPMDEVKSVIEQDEILSSLLDWDIGELEVHQQ
ncbi:MAG: orc1/cdc6 family replication initiation protein [Aigarchaeota archaeon]|nr:orc1/cdc6 family replication initiation protein [Aigarchaeota archaeon]MDW8093055.1 orc1/cdc6 family replication initiation protein [Nitrososphaerota archaeon]